MCTVVILARIFLLQLVHSHANNHRAYLHELCETFFEFLSQKRIVCSWVGRYVRPTHLHFPQIFIGKFVLNCFQVLPRMNYVTAATSNTQYRPSFQLFNRPIILTSLWRWKGRTFFFFFFLSWIQNRKDLPQIASHQTDKKRITMDWRVGSHCNPFIHQHPS